MSAPGGERSGEGSQAEEVLEGGHAQGGVVSRTWSAVPRRRRRGLAVTVGVLLAVVALGSVIGQVNQGRRERELRDRVTLTATMEVSAASTVQSGGRVDYYATVRNIGPLEVRVADIRLDDARLHIVSRGFAEQVVLPGTTVEIPLSVRLDCVPVGAGGPGQLKGTISATPESGHHHAVPTTVVRAALVTDVADTLCGVRPSTRGRELSGLVS